MVGKSRMLTAVQYKRRNALINFNRTFPYEPVRRPAGFCYLYPSSQSNHMLLQGLLFLLLILYLTLLATAFHKLVFESRLPIGRKLLWALALVFLPIIGSLLFYTRFKADKDELSTYTPSRWKRAAKALAAVVMMLTIVYLVVIVTVDNRDTPPPASGPPVYTVINNTPFSSIVQYPVAHYELTKKDLLALQAIDTSDAYQLSETGYCDTTVHLNDSIRYSIISISDLAGICSAIRLVTVNTKQEKPVAVKGLYKDCNVDYSWDSYELFDHLIIAPGRIRVTRTTVFQKKDRVAGEEEQNIDHTEVEPWYFIISPDGSIHRVPSQ